MSRGLNGRVSRLEQSQGGRGPPRLLVVALDVPGGLPDQALYCGGEVAEVPDGRALLARAEAEGRPAAKVLSGVDYLRDL